MNGTLQEYLSLKLDLKNRKEKFDKFRISNGHIGVSDIKNTKNTTVEANPSLQYQEKGNEKSKSGLIVSIKSFGEKLRYSNKKLKSI